MKEILLHVLGQLDREPLEKLRAWGSLMRRRLETGGSRLRSYPATA